MYFDEFPNRLTRLREKKGVSARDMSLSIGQNPGYINNIENGKTLPSMSGFFYICDYLNISPSDFFNINSECPQQIKSLAKDLELLDSEELDAITTLVKRLIENKA